MYICIMKICFKCGVEKPLDDYYKHSQMGDGHLNKCKDCTKNDTKIRCNNLRNNQQWVKSERKRGREKYHRLYKGVKGDSLKIYNYTKIYRAKYPEKYKAKSASNKIKCDKGYNLHHWSYNKDHYKDVIELSIKEHLKAHRFLIYDQERFMYRRIDTMELLDTKQRHLDYINYVILNEED